MFGSVRPVPFPSLKAPLAASLALLALAISAGGAAAQQAPDGAFAFASPPSAQANRVYSVNRQTGEVSACQFERPDASTAGITRCFARGEGAGPQSNGIYKLVSTGFAGETGVFRVNASTGEMSICYVRDMPKTGGGTEAKILCTPPAK